MMRLWICLLSVLTVFDCVSQDESFTHIKPSDVAIRIVGRVKDDKDSVTIYWPGTSILIRFKGTSLKAQLKDEHGKNYFNVVLDGDSVRYFKLDTLKRYYELASNLKDGEHTVELIKRTEWDLGKTWFYAMEVQGNLLSLPAKKKRVMEFFGNSITAGYAIENYTGGDAPDSIYTNNYATYAAITARHYNADLYCTVKSGIGIMISWFPLIMPEMYNRLDPNDSTSRWDFGKVTPDIVVVNLFQNDSWLFKLPDHPSFKQRFGNKAPDEKTIIRSYRAFIEKVRTVYPKASIVCALGPMDATKKGSSWPGYIKQAVNELHDDHILIHFFPFNNKNGHPRKEDNVKMAESLIAFIDKHIKW